MMFFKLAVLVFFTIIFLGQASTASSQDASFTYNGFRSISNITLDGLAEITSNGLLHLTNKTRQKTAHAFCNEPVKFKASPNGSAFSFSTTFVFAILAESLTLSGHGIVFTISQTKNLTSALPSQYLGFVNDKINGNATNHIFGVELDTIESNEFGDINDNHVGIDINGLRSANSTKAGYYDDKSGQFRNLSLISRKPMQVWVDYNGITKEIVVNMAPINVGKPKTPILTLTRDLSPVMVETMYLGFTSATGSVISEHYVLGWSFSTNGEAQPLDLSKLPKLPRIEPKKVSDFFKIGLPLISLTLIFLATFLVVYVIRRKKKFEEVLEDWELDYGANRFKFKDLYHATKGFKDKELIGAGGFGRVYRGILPGSKLEVAVKRVSHDSKQGIKEFVAEIVSIGRMSHRNLVPLLGYCRRRGELLLVYDYMPNGSLDKYLHNDPEVTLNWRQRFWVIKGVASALNYLHREWEQVVIHRDVKASNVLLDGELNGRLGDFGLARLYDHGSDPKTTHVVGTLGYLAPEHTRTGKATTATDVYAFGAFLLEVACGRRPIEMRGENDESFLLVDWVFGCWLRGNILEATDPKLGSDYDQKEVELALTLGLLCSHSDPKARPSLRQILHYLDGETKLPDLSPLDVSASGKVYGNRDGFSEFGFSNSSFMFKDFTGSSSIADSLLSGGR